MPATWSEGGYYQALCLVHKVEVDVTKYPTSHADCTPCHQVPRLPRRMHGEVMCGQVVGGHVMWEWFGEDMLWVNKLCDDKLCMDKLCEDKLCGSDLVKTNYVWVIWRRQILCVSKLCAGKLYASDLVRTNCDLFWAQERSATYRDLWSVPGWIWYFAWS